MADDPQPEFRCRCVHRRTFPGSDHEDELFHGSRDYYDRCPSRPTQEDGLCDHCRPSECTTCGEDFPCCLHPSQRRRLVDLTTPCLDMRPIKEEAPF